MPYATAVYVKAKEILRQRKEKAEKELEERHIQVCKACPEILELESQMAQQGAEIVKAIGMGNDAQAFILQLAQKNLTVQEKKTALIRAAGFPANYLEPEYTCPKCRDTGTYDTYYCECYKKLVKEIAYAQLAEKSPLKLCSFDRFRLDYYPDTPSESGVSVREHMTGIFNFCREYASDFGTHSPSLLMTGYTGLGKTHLSLSIAEQVIKKGYAVVYDSTQNIINKIKREQFSKSTSEDDTELLLEDCDLLILDDLGAEYATQFTVATLYNIINTRMLRNTPVIINTNLTPKEIEEKYTNRIASRIIGDYIPLYFLGKDIRQLKS